jgi:hypothetical protein
MTASGFPTLAGVHFPTARGDSQNSICREKNLVRLSNRAEGSAQIMSLSLSTVKKEFDEQRSSENRR